MQGSALGFFKRIECLEEFTRQGYKLWEAAIYQGPYSDDYFRWYPELQSMISVLPITIINNSIPAYYVPLKNRKNTPLRFRWIRTKKICWKFKSDTTFDIPFIPADFLSYVPKLLWKEWVLDGRVMNWRRGTLREPQDEEERCCGRIRVFLKRKN